MPELPEVRSICRRLRSGDDRTPTLISRVVQSGAVSWERTLVTPPVAEFGERIAGQVIQAVDRRGKYLILRLDRDVLLIHLRMSGDLLLVPQAESRGAYSRLTLTLDNGHRLEFSDA